MYDHGEPFSYMTGLLQRLIMTVSLQKDTEQQILQKYVTFFHQYLCFYSKKKTRVTSALNCEIPYDS